MRRRLSIKGTVDFGSGPEYQSPVAVIPAENRIAKASELGRCSLIDKFAPADCLGRCEISGVTALRHLLSQSEVSGRTALPEFVALCPETGGRHSRMSESRRRFLVAPDVGALIFAKSDATPLDR